jgi:hypothetical protein
MPDFDNNLSLDLTQPWQQTVAQLGMLPQGPAPNALAPALPSASHALASLHKLLPPGWGFVPVDHDPFAGGSASVQSS